MYCSQCGKPVADDAKFCAACGTAVGGSARAPAQSAATAKTFCQIEKYAKQGAFSGWTIYFYADAIGPNGKFRAAESKHLKSFLSVGLEEGMEKTHTAFVAQLVADGWVPQADRGTHWWQMRFSKD